jgi:hypothetical protein
MMVISLEDRQDLMGDEYSNRSSGRMQSNQLAVTPSTIYTKLSLIAPIYECLTKRRYSKMLEERRGLLVGISCFKNGARLIPG